MRRAWPRSIVVALASALAGCSLVWNVDPHQWDRDAGDGGIDAGDGGTPEDGGDSGSDGGPDAGDGGNCEPFERVCMGGGDEDCDGLVDCNDTDCATNLLECCGPSSTVFSEGFMPIPDEWPWLPLSLGTRPFQGPSATTLNNFDVGDPRALRAPQCLPIDLGVQIEARLTPSHDTPSCPTAEPCENYASLVLTAASDVLPGESLPDDLSVRVYSDGRAEIRQAGAVLASTAMGSTPFGMNPIQVTIQLTPGVHDDGLAYVFATVTLSQTGRTEVWPTTGWIERPTIPREYLVGPALGCNVARGLYLAIEGTGTEVTVDNLAVTQYGCANPGHFEPVGAVGLELDADDLDGDPTDNSDWAHGGVGSPSIQSFLTTAPSTDRWELFYDASNRERTLEPRDDVHHAIGGSFTTDDEGVALYAPRQSANPLLGLNPPDCIGTEMPIEGCSMLRGAREPAIHTPVDPRTRVMLSGATHILVYAREIQEAGSPTGRYELWHTRVERTDVALTYGSVLLSPAGDCRSLRDPVIVPTRPGTTDDLYVLYRCEREGTGSVIRAIHLPEYPPADGTVELVPGDVIVPTAPGPGVRAPDVAVWALEGDRVLVRVWYLSEVFGQPPAIAFAEGVSDLGSLPQLVPYAANPVLRSNDPVLGTCPADGCDIESLAVTRIALEPSRVRLLVSRTMERDTGIEHVFVPLEQRWPVVP